MFYPDQPKKFNRIHWVMRQTGWTPKPWYWKAGTVVDWEDRGPGINRHCKDVSKSNVDRIFTEAFGYSSFIDPSGTGKAVIKSERNAAHDGRVVNLPYNLKKGEVCQRLIDTGLSEYRVLIVNREVACVMVKKKKDVFSSRGCRFQTWMLDYGLLHWGERTLKIPEFCGKIGMDYGELDFLRGSEGRGYIVDANPCPGGVGKAFLNQSKQELDYFIQCHRPLFKHT